LSNCIESILAQTWRPLEIVVADDASNDGTVELIDDYRRLHPTLIKSINHPRRVGITANSNAALEACSGTYIAWMGGDDVMLPEKLEHQVRAMEADENCAICYHDLELFTTDKDPAIGLFSHFNKPREGGFATLLRYGSFNGACSTMIRTSAASGLRFDERLPVASDWFYWLNILAGGGSIRYIDRVLGRYRRHAENVTAERSPLFRQGLEDHVVAAAIAMCRFPTWHGAARHRLARNIFAMRRTEPQNYRAFVAASLGVSPTWQAIVAFATFFASAGRLRL
jgi:glycosyltransferase involved in cell wall biosynthesis